MKVWACVEYLEYTRNMTLIPLVRRNIIYSFKFIRNIVRNNYVPNNQKRTLEKSTLYYDRFNILKGNVFVDHDELSIVFSQRMHYYDLQDA